MQFMNFHHQMLFLFQCFYVKILFEGLILSLIFLNHPTKPVFMNISDKEECFDTKPFTYDSCLCLYSRSIWSSWSQFMESWTSFKGKEMFLTDDLYFTVRAGWIFWHIFFFKRFHMSLSQLQTQLKFLNPHRHSLTQDCPLRPRKCSWLITFI